MSDSSRLEGSWGRSTARHYRCLCARVGLEFVVISEPPSDVKMALRGVRELYAMWSG